MLDFEAELNKLLSLETGRLPEHEWAALAAAEQELLAELNKKQSDVSLQVEEIYDLVKEQGFWRETVVAEKSRADQLVWAAIGLADLLEDFCVYAGQSGSEELEHQTKLLWDKAGGILAGRGILRFGEAGESLNPRIHTVQAGTESPLPREQVIRVLQSGYMYQSAIVRKAAVVVSRGQENTLASEQEGPSEGDYTE
jgi:molecular chaperone GrpE (heat shock protein)